MENQQEETINPLIPREEEFFCYNVEGKWNLSCSETLCCSEYIYCE